jgi:ADP-ribosyl-[dinitrogen reductase] hydrolase
MKASIWCLLTTYGYDATVLKAVNLEYDTDTNATVTGALAGMIYGIDEIPLQ